MSIWSSLSSCFLSIFTCWIFLFRQACICWDSVFNMYFAWSEPCVLPVCFMRRLYVILFTKRSLLYVRIYISVEHSILVWLLSIPFPVGFSTEQSIYIVPFLFIFYEHYYSLRLLYWIFSYSDEPVSTEILYPLRFCIHCVNVFVWSEPCVLPMRFLCTQPPLCLLRLVCPLCVPISYCVDFVLSTFTLNIFLSILIPMSLCIR